MLNKWRARFRKWRKKKIEEKYFKTFPERKGLATMEIVTTRVRPQTFYVKQALDPIYCDPRFGRNPEYKDQMKSYLSCLRKNMARKLGEDLLNEGMIDIHEGDTIADFYADYRMLVASIRVIPPVEKVRYPELKEAEDGIHSEGEA